MREPHVPDGRCQVVEHREPARREQPGREVAVLDDLTPPVRDVWLAHPALAATELLTAAGAAAILAVRL